jgi:hypothetical protein
MTSTQARDETIAELDRSVRDTLDYFAGPGRANPARIDRWGAWDVLAHLPYWHYATAWGIRSATLGGPPWQVPGTADEVNDACLALQAGDGVDDILDRLRRLQERLVSAAREAPDWDAPAFRMPDGRLVSIQQRLETIARHWRGHLDALREAGAN